MDWGKLHKRFLALADITGIYKSSSYTMTVMFGQEGGVIVELGGYDIGDWPRHTYVGGFRTEQEAYDATEKKIEEAERIVKQEGAGHGNAKAEEDRLD